MGVKGWKNAQLQLKGSTLMSLSCIVSIWFWPWLRRISGKHVVVHSISIFQVSSQWILPSANHLKRQRRRRRHTAQRRDTPKVPTHTPQAFPSTVGSLRSRGEAMRGDTRSDTSALWGHTHYLPPNHLPTWTLYTNAREGKRKG